VKILFKSQQKSTCTFTLTIPVSESLVAETYCNPRFQYGAATIRATQHIINASYNQRHRFFHLSPEPRML
jgi:hypothetical protein